jgi:exodeoxyribonuclease VII small subunit
MPSGTAVIRDGPPLRAPPRLRGFGRAARQRLKCPTLQRKAVSMPKAPSPTSSPAAESGAPALPATYEEAMRELEQLVVRLESGELPLEQLLAAYQRGAELMQFCHGRLEAVESQIKMLDGSALKPWTPE